MGNSLPVVIGWLCVILIVFVSVRIAVRVSSYVSLNAFIRILDGESLRQYISCLQLEIIKPAGGEHVLTVEKQKKDNNLSFAIWRTYTFKIERIIYGYF